MHMEYGKNTYLDDTFVLANLMGPDCLRILDELSGHFPIAPGARILDLGCGRGLTSIYLAKEYASQVFAVDLWIDASENLERFAMLGMDDRIIPLHADAHSLPFAQRYFDVVVSIDSYQYFGAKQDFLDTHIAPLVKPDGVIAISVPGLQKGLDQSMLPGELTRFWGGADIDFHPLQWWERLFSHSQMTVREATFSHRCHRKAWQTWLGCDNPYAKQDVEMMEIEAGRYFDTIGLVYRVKR